jgi:integrase/recombinase XerD
MVLQKDILQDFEDYLDANPLPSRSRAGASAKTIKGYVHDVGDFLKWWKQTEGEDLTIKSLCQDPFALNKKAIQDYINYIEKRVEISTVLRKVSALRAFVRFLGAEKVIEHDPMYGLRLPTKEAPEPRGLTDRQRSRFEAVFQQPWLDRTPKRKRTKEVEESVLGDAKNRLIRDRAIAFLMLYSGPRVDEVFQLNINDIELKEKSGSLHIRRGKGFMERRTAIPLPARKALQLWLELRNKLGQADKKAAPLFITLRGANKQDRYSIRSIQHMVAEAGKRARIQEPVTPHVLRHTCAYMLRQAGVDIETRAKMLGHSIETAARYGAPGESEIERAASLLDHAEAA